MLPFPSATGLTHLRVYDTPGPDGVPGGSPHLHLACTELYFVTAGHGAVETLGPDGLRVHDLRPGGVVWFSPGVVHRLINTGRDLQILVVMQNAGLPEAGDFVLMFPPEVLGDPEAYRRAASLAEGTKVYATDAEAARRRRDLAVEGYLALKADHARRGVTALDDLYRRALPLVSHQLPKWSDLVERGPVRQSQLTQEQLARLVAGDASHLHDGRAASYTPPESTRLGMCGHLTLYLPEGATV